jgi:cytidylate kinase
MYRAVTLYVLQNKKITSEDVNSEIIISILDEIDLHFKLNLKTNKPELLLNDQSVSDEIRSPLVSSMVSKISAIKEVRQKLVKEQRKIGAEGGIVMEGRDIGSVVFPKAELKLFITADIETRVNRRYQELAKAGITVTRDEVKSNLRQRDRIDSTRKESPLTKTIDAIEIDNTKLSPEEQLQLVVKLVNEMDN